MKEILSHAGSFDPANKVLKQYTYCASLEAELLHTGQLRMSYSSVKVWNCSIPAQNTCFASLQLN